MQLLLPVTTQMVSLLYASILKKVALPGLLLVALLLHGCRKDPVITADGKTASVADFYVPAGWPTPHYSFTENPLKPEIIALGKKLFNEPMLSRTNDVSCGSCHQPASAFAQADHAVSHGVESRLGTRNTPGLFNLAWYTSFMWDGGGKNIETQILAPLQNHVEMDITLEEMVARVSRSPVYQKAFSEAYGSPEINLVRILKSIAQFEAVLISDGAKWDKVQRGTAQFTTAEKAGETVFAARCASCHTPPLFTDFSFRSNGLAVTSVNDSGQMHITRLVTDMYKFKVPSLRNWAFTAPYFHDGRARALEDVLAHYTTTLPQQSPAYTDAQLKGGVALSEVEKTQLKAFLHTLNDTAFMENVRFR